MKPKHLFTSILAVTALFVASCSTSKLAQNNAVQDDVYNTTAQAKAYQEVVQPEPALAQNETKSDDYYGTSDPYYDMDYATRINRFYYANPWRNYYDDIYGFSPYAYDGAFMFGPSAFAFGWNNWSNPYRYWSYYGSPYFNNYWGLYSYYNPIFWGGGYYGGGFLGGGGYYGSIGRGRSANYGPRPIRGSENGINRTGTSYADGPNGISRGNSTSSRAERYNPSNPSNPSNAGTRTSSTANGRSTTGTAGSTPTRSSAGDSRPTRSNDAPPPTRTYSPPVQSSPPPSSSGSRAESGSSSGGGGGGRPTRGGGR